MNREEAKSVLVVCRPNGADANDPRLAEALSLVKNDAELRAWFEAEQSADKAIAAKLKAAPLPDDLLARIRGGTQARIAGKPRRLLSYIGGVGTYRQKCEDLAQQDYAGFDMR